VDLRDPWVVSLTIRYDSTSSCTVAGAVLNLDGSPWSALGTLEGGRVTCTGERTWSAAHGVAADIWGPRVTVQLREPPNIRFTTFLYGEAFPRHMSGIVTGLSGPPLGTWSAHQGDCSALEIASGLCPRE
jgi:hypothetical protein